MPAVVLHFHPGWPTGRGTVLDAMVRDGAYLSQWVTGSSNGGLTAHTGGDRWRWESRLFDGRYDEARPEDRPVYGAWNRRDDPYGAATRFGSAHLRLRPHVLDRATFCWPDSVFSPDAVGGAADLDDLCSRADGSLQGDGTADPLDDYVEAHVHGGVDLADDVEALVLDPTDLAHHVGVTTALSGLGVAVECHPGFAVAADAIDPDYRSDVPVALARRLGGVVTPAVLGAAARRGEHDAQAVKWLWHCLARFGRVDA